MIANLVRFLVCLVVLGGHAMAGVISIDQGDPLKHLVLDSRLISRTSDVRLVLGKIRKDPRNPLFEADRPWENALNNLYPNVLYDGDEKLFKLWYKCVLHDKDIIARMMPPATVHDQGWFLLYATSTDGIHWRKPQLGLHGFDGSRRNNAVARDTPNVGVFKDTRPDVDPERRYKMIYDVGLGKMRVCFSPDGVNWSDPLIPRGLDRNGDTHNNAFWDERRGRYVLITRFYIGERLVARSESEDFLNWDPPTLALRSTIEEGATRQTYCMSAFPYGNIYLGYVMMYNAKTDRTVDCELAWSPDSVTWRRVVPGTPFIPRGPEGSYDSKCIYAPAGRPIVQDGRLLIFYGGDDFVHRGWKRHCLPCLARLRADGFAGYRSAGRGRGVVVTQPMLCTSAPLRVSADAEGGSVRVGVLGQRGFGLKDCRPVRTNVTDEPLKWNGQDLSLLAGKMIQLEFELVNATLYAFHGLELVPVPMVRPGIRRFERSVTIELPAPAGFEKAAIRYTLDGSDPTVESRVYSDPVTLNRTATLKARLYLPGVDGGGPVTAETFTKHVPPDAALPGRPKPIVTHRARFDEDDEGWQAIGELVHHRGGGHRGGYVTIRRQRHQPYAKATSQASGGAFAADLAEQFGGTGVEIVFHQRAERPAGACRVELIGNDFSLWYRDNLPAATGDWAPVRLKLRYDWNDAEARAAGWNPALKAVPWRQTVKHVGSLVVAPYVTGSVRSFDLDELTMRTIYE